MTVVPMSPPDAHDLAAYLGLAEPDQRCKDSIAAAVQWVQNRRFRTDWLTLWNQPDVNLGALQYGALLYQVKSTPVGLPEYDDLASTYGTSMAGIHRLVGGPDPAVC